MVTLKGIFLSENCGLLLEIVSRIKKFLSEKLKLTLHPEKIILKIFASGVDFLDWRHFPHHRILRRTTEQKIFLQTRKNPKQETLQSCLGLINRRNTFKIRQQLLADYWLRR